MPELAEKTPGYIFQTKAYFNLKAFDEEKILGTQLKILQILSLLILY